MSSYISKWQVLSKMLVVPLLIFVASSLLSLNTYTTPAYAAACGSEPSSTTGRSSQTITVPANGTYTIWSRLKAPNASPVEYTAYLNGQCFTIGQTALTPNTLTWGDYENGSTADKATVSLSAGVHTLVLTAGSEDLELDRVMLLSDSCTPTGTGDNCSNDTTLPTTSITSPSAGNTLTGTTSVNANAADNDAIDYVEFYRGGTTLLGTDTSAPFSYSWDTTAVTDGAHSLTVRAYDLSGNVRTSAAVSVTVNNAPVINANISSFTATPATISVGQSSSLAWSVSAGTGCSINQGVGAVGLSGNQSVSPTSTVTYTLSCNGSNGGASASAQATITVNPAPVNANISSFTATPSTITTGQSSSLAWSVSAGTGCSIDQSIGAVGASGNQNVSPTVTTTYTLTCNGLNGGSSDSAQTTVTFDTSPVNANIFSFTATPSTITEGQSSSLGWSVSAGTGCSINQSIGAVGATGTQSVLPVSTTTYTLTCNGLNGGTSDSEQVTITVNPAPLNANISSFTATPSTITVGQNSTLAWTVSAGTGCSINQGIGTVATPGNQTVSPSSTVTYTLTCNGLNGGTSDSEQVIVTVNPAPVNADITSFTATPGTITDQPGQTSTLQWAISAGSGCSINQGVGNVANSGTQLVSPVSTTTYTLTCNGQYGGSTDTALATVNVTAAPDTDNDGVKDYIESAGPNSGDSNFDSIQDHLQANVVTLINAKSSAYNTLVSEGSCDVASNASSLNGNESHILGAWSFELSCDASGDSGQVVIYLDKVYDTSNWKVSKVNSAFTDAVDISPRVVTTPKTLGMSSVTALSYTITDGTDMDEDGTANGSIADPIAVSLNAGTAPTDTLSNTGQSQSYAIMLSMIAITIAAVGLMVRYFSFVTLPVNFKK